MSKRQPTRHAPQEIDEYLAALPAEKRASLRQLREIIRRIAPHASERVNYRTPLFRLRENFVGFSAAKIHCALHTFNKDLVASLRDELKAAGLRHSGGTIHCQPEREWPVVLVENILRARLAELGEG